MTCERQPDVVQSSEDYFMAAVDRQRKFDAMQLAVYAQACGLPGVPVTGPLRVVNNHFPPPIQPAPAAVSPQPAVAGAASGLSPVLKGALLGIGGPALLAAGSLLPGLFNQQPAPVPTNPPVITSPDQQVEIGTIGPDGKIIPPTN